MTNIFKEDQRLKKYKIKMTNQMFSENIFQAQFKEYVVLVFSRCCKKDFF